jgi:hypothetical protein
MSVYRVHCEVRQTFSFLVTAKSEEDARVKVSGMDEKEILAWAVHDNKPIRNITIEKIELDNELDKEE